MMSMNRLRSIACAFATTLAFAAMGSAASAQDDSAPAAQSQAQAQAHDAHDDEELRRLGRTLLSGADARALRHVGSHRLQEGGQLAVSVSIVYVPSRDEHLLQFVVPLGIDLGKGAKLVTDSYTSEMWRYHHCDRIGCYVIVPQGNALVDALKGQPSMKVRVVQFRGKSFDLSRAAQGLRRGACRDGRAGAAKGGQQARARAGTRTQILKFRTYKRSVPVSR